MNEELLKQILNEIKALRIEMNDRFDEMKHRIHENQVEDIKADEVILKTLFEYKKDITEEIVTHEHQFKVLNNQLMRLAADVDRLKSF